MFKEYIEEMKAMVKDGVYTKTVANNRVHGFKAGMDGEKWESYRALQKQFVEDGFSDKEQAHAKLEGLRDYQNRV